MKSDYPNVWRESAFIVWSSVVAAVRLTANLHKTATIRDVLGQGKHCILRIWRIVAAVRYEKQLGINTIGIQRFADRSRKQDAIYYEPVRYEELKRVLRYLSLDSSDVVMDVGCGLGRAVLYFAQHSPAKVVGVELVSDLAKQAESFVAQLGLQDRARILVEDAATLNPGPITVRFFFNPFGPETLNCLFQRVKDSLSQHPRELRVVYVNPAHRAVLDVLPWLADAGPIPKTRAWVWRHVPASPPRTSPQFTLAGKVSAEVP